MRGGWSRKKIARWACVSAPIVRAHTIIFFEWDQFSLFSPGEGTAHWHSRAATWSRDFRWSGGNSIGQRNSALSYFLLLQRCLLLFFREYYWRRMTTRSLGLTLEELECTCRLHACPLRGFFLMNCADNSTEVTRSVRMEENEGGGCFICCRTRKKYKKTKFPPYCITSRQTKFEEKKHFVFS